jgi:hypothetical protein
MAHGYRRHYLADSHLCDGHRQAIRTNKTVVGRAAGSKAFSLYALWLFGS